MSSEHVIIAQFSSGFEYGLNTNKIQIKLCALLLLLLLKGMSEGHVLRACLEGI